MRAVILAAVVAAASTSIDAAPPQNIPTCAVCGRRSLYVRHATLARRGGARPWS